MPDAKPNAGDPAKPAGDPAKDASTKDKPASKGDDKTKTDVLSDDQIDLALQDPRIFKSKRFAELNAKAKKADQLEADAKTAKDKKLAEDNKWEELAEQRKTELDEAATKANSVLINADIQVKAAQKGVIDPEVVGTLIDKSEIKVGDDGKVEGVETAMESLLTDKPYLLGDKKGQPVGSGTNPADGSGVNKWKHSDLLKMSPTEWKENQPAILAAIKNNQVPHDL